MWEITFLDDRVAEEFKALPPKISANMTHIFKLLRLYGNQVGEPQTKSLGDGLFEIRAKGAEGIGRGMFCYMTGRRIYILHVFVKKSDKIPQKELNIARNRLKELKNA